ncbi:flavin reductase family protein [Kutzneria buriramensis]|nr:flavin reductase family protein [Kutzneria buriramensis]
MSRFPSGVAVVAADGRDDGPWGMTCSSVCSVSLEPLTLLVCLRTGSPTLRAVLDCGQFSVNLLHERARDTAELFASGDPNRFDRVRWERPPAAAGPHLVADAHTIADCWLDDTRPVGDHVVVFGVVGAITELPAHRPLLYGLREYHSWPRR